MWPNWMFVLMAMLAAFLFGILCYPAVRELNATLACWWITRRNNRVLQFWERQRAERMREVLR